DGQGQGDRQKQGDLQGQQGKVVQDLFQQDEVFRHFKKHHEKRERPWGLGERPWGSGPPIIRSSDPSVVETVSKHSSMAIEEQWASHIGEGALSNPIAN
ncbi:unnamed protein product, partial [Discosporangium mesarthrocarpum]